MTVNEDFEKLFQEVDKSIKQEITVECPKCKNELKLEVPIS